PADLQPDVVDGATQHQPERPEPRLTDEQELVHRQVRGEDATGASGAELGQAAQGILRNTLGAQLSALLVGQPFPSPAHAASPAEYCPSGSQLYPGRLTALRVERQDRQRWWRLGHRGKPDKSGPHDGGLHDVIFTVFLDRG